MRFPHRLTVIALLAGALLWGRWIPVAAAQLDTPPASPESPAESNLRWSVTVYMGAIVENEMVTVPANLHKTDYGFRIWAIAAAYRFAQMKQTLAFEAEGQYAKHYRGNDHSEINVLGVVRFLPFPWDKFIDTSFGAGGGVSFASEVPKYEEAHFTKNNDVLAYGLFEFDFFVPKFPWVGAAARLHHRSGLYGTFNDVYAGSNYVTLGFKAKF